MRFSIRDLLWATVVVAMGLGWWVHYRWWYVNYRALNAQRLEAVEQAHRHRAILRIARDATEKHQQQLQAVADALIFSRRSVKDSEARRRLEAFEAFPVDWSVLDEPLVEP